MVIFNDELYIVLYDDDGGIFVVNFEDRIFEKVLEMGWSFLKYIV